MLTERFSDFKVNKKYHKHRKDLEKQGRLCRVRLLDPNSPNSPKKRFYSSEIIKEFDEFYTKNGKS
jgi:hypothetical protein